MTKSESEIQQEVRLEASLQGVIIKRNAVGSVETQSGHTVRYGLGTGSSDLVGFLRDGAIFVALEVKTPVGLAKHKLALARVIRKNYTGLTKEEKRAFEQQMFVDLVRNCGGIAGFPTSREDARELICQAKTPSHSKAS
jgi:hypothetical protein